jgi:aspartate/methionine/tyrosine aminotransferase
MPGIAVTRPQGAFYLFPNITETGKTSAEITQYLLDEAHIAVVPGSVFGQYGEGYIRMSYANSYDNLERAMHSMRRALEKL